MTINKIQASLQHYAKENCITVTEAIDELKKYQEKREKFIARLPLVKNIEINATEYKRQSQKDVIILETPEQILSFLDDLTEPCTSIRINFKNGSYYYTGGKSSSYTQSYDSFMVNFCLKYF